MQIIHRTDPPAGVSSFICEPSLALNVGDTLYATLEDSRVANRCIGFSARLEPIPSGLPSEVLPHTTGDSSNDNEIIGAVEFQSPCEGSFSFDIRFPGASRPISLPEATNPKSAVASVNFLYSAGPATASDGGGCAPSCNVFLDVSVEVIRDKDAQP